MGCFFTETRNVENMVWLDGGGLEWSKTAALLHVVSQQERDWGAAPCCVCVGTSSYIVRAGEDEEGEGTFEKLSAICSCCGKSFSRHGDFVCVVYISCTCCSRVEWTLRCKGSRGREESV